MSKDLHTHMLMCTHTDSFYLPIVSLYSSGHHYILKKANPFGPELMMFTRLFTADHTQLQEFAALDDTALHSRLSAEPLTKSDLKVLDFLAKR